MVQKPAEKSALSEPNARRSSRQWLTFMEFVHRQEEARSNASQKRRAKGKEEHDSREVLFELFELLLAGVMLFAVITLLLLVIN